MSTDVSFTSAFSALLSGHPTVVVGVDSTPTPIPVERWAAPADEDDRRILTLCHGPTLDVGCGPGRMAMALAETGRIALGIDVVAEAVAQTRRRGASALQRDVFAEVPAEGRWGTVLLADGNIGIGGDPVALLGRAADLLAPGGRAVVEVAEPGVASRTVWAVLESQGGKHRSRPFRWAVLGVDGLAGAAASSGLGVRAVHQIGGRWVAVLVREESRT
ncbi:class I SAM-dependent methyltransferase [Nocardioides jensenii]|uniref:class I SAM-dependent methyltransferase n=1 Tax=Nocardioides jensenii TaxID=1843 RepID=UPI0009E97FFF|nr:class I SAM-dependent methyltransferase [Nocardioides jensenii]